MPADYTRPANLPASRRISRVTTPGSISSREPFVLMACLDASVREIVIGAAGITTQLGLSCSQRDKVKRFKKNVGYINAIF